MDCITPEQSISGKYNHDSFSRKDSFNISEKVFTCDRGLTCLKAKLLQRSNTSDLFTCIIKPFKYRFTPHFWLLDKDGCSTQSRACYRTQESYVACKILTND